MSAAKRIRNIGTGLRAFVTCPFCGYDGVHLGNPCKWCARCFVRYEVGPKWVTFDPGMGPRSEGEAWAMAIAKSGGMKIGGGDAR